MKNGRANNMKAVKFIDSTREILKSYNKPKSMKRKRTKLTEEQIAALEESFKLNQHPTTEMKESIAQEINIPIKNVQIWFQNRRAKDKAIRENIELKSREYLRIDNNYKDYYDGSRGEHEYYRGQDPYYYNPGGYDNYEEEQYDGFYQKRRFE